jgi:hypothetical protein
MWRSSFAKLINALTLAAHSVLQQFISEDTLLTYKPIHLCWWFEKHGYPIPTYFIASGSTAPTVTDSAATSIKELSATGNGNVTSDGGATVTQRGFVFSVTSVNSNPLLSGTGVTQINSTGTTGAWSDTLTPLVANTGYSYKAFATNSKGTGYGTVQTFTSANLPTVALNTPADAATGQSTTPTLNFTGTNPDGETVEYEVQVDTVNTFDGQSSTPAYIQGTSGSVVGGTSFNLTAFGSNCGAGNLIVVSIRGGAVAVSTVTDASGNTYTKAVARADTPTNELWYAYNIVGGVKPVITVTMASSTTACAGAQEFSGILSTSDPLDKTSSGHGTSGSPSSGATATTTQNTELVVGGLSYTTFTPAAGSGFSNLLTFNDGTDWGFIESKVVTSTGAQTATSSTSFSVAWDCTVATFKASTSPLLDKLSTTDTGFTAGHPFASGVAKDFTVQAGDTLTASTTYYWRVRAADAPESSSYGSWATTRSFTTAAGGGGTPSPSVSDSTAVSDTPAILITALKPSVSDSTAVSDTPTLSLKSYINVSDSSAVTDTPTIEEISLPSVSDSTAIGETVALSVQDFVNVTDSTAVSDTITIYITTWFFSVSDSTAVSDTPTLSIQNFVNVSDSTAVSDTPSITIPLPFSVSDSSAVTDTITPESFSFVNVTDSSTVTDTITVSPTSYISVTDSSVVTDTATIEDIEQGVSVADSTAVGEAVQMQVVSFVAVSDSSAVSDTVTVESFSFVSVTDSTAIGEAVTVKVSDPQVNVSDTTTINENVSLLVVSPGAVNVQDSTTVSDTATLFLPTYYLNVSDSTAVSDSPTLAVSSPLINTADSTAVSDSVSLQESGTTSLGYSFVVFID